MVNVVSVALSWIIMSDIYEWIHDERTSLTISMICEI